jgi:hypothetical protein
MIHIRSFLLLAEKKESTIYSHISKLDSSLQGEGEGAYKLGNRR